jgi:site-specific DNA-methyltransferase (adenine-specific)
MNESIKLYNDDCIQQMKRFNDNEINLILTDPPYNIARENNFNTMGRTGIDFGEWDKGFDQFVWLNEIPRILHKDGSVIIFNDWKNVGEIARYCENLGLVIKDMLRWRKSNPMPRNRDRRYITDFECAIWLTNKNAKWTFNRLSDTYQRPEFEYGLVSGKDKIHPTQKPVKLMEELLLIHSNENDLILDCFLGSGATGVACKNTNRRFLGIELDNTYFNVAQKRILEA